MGHNLNLFVKMGDNLVLFFLNGRQAQVNGKMEDNLKFGKWKMTSIFVKIEDNLRVLLNGRLP